LNRLVNRYLQILGIHSAKELIRYKSFFLLILVIIAADWLVHRYVNVQALNIKPAEIIQMGPQAARFIFETLPEMVLERFFDYRTAVLLIGMFLLKQIISLWPSSDMRRMHRRERRGFGIITSLRTVRGQQILWDAVAVGSICILAGGWVVFSFLICRSFWLHIPSPIWSLVLAALILVISPIIMAGFSYSSKIAVISRGRFLEKIGLFYKLFTSLRIFVMSWIFFVIRITVEFIFVVAIPGLVILTIPFFPIRILVASLSAILVYSYLKMATFKFFLQVYGRFPHVQQEYEEYYVSLQHNSIDKESGS
jgi:hypothetical protein